MLEISKKIPFVITYQATSLRPLRIYRAISQFYLNRLPI